MQSTDKNINNVLIKDGNVILFLINTLYSKKDVQKL